MTVRVTTASRTNRGGRPDNEDAVVFDVTDRWGCWIIADGLGGHRGGEIASRAAARTALDVAHQQPNVSVETLTTAVAAADDSVRATQRERGIETMRTTLTVLLSDLDTAAWAHVGDSRLYRFRGGRLVAQTIDHSVPQMLADSGDITAKDIRHHPDRSRLVRVLGQEGAAKPTLSDDAPRLASGDAFLLCTDGWWELVYETEMEIDLAKAADADAWLDAMTDRLLARATGDYDNYSAIAVLFHRD